MVVEQAASVEAIELVYRNSFARFVRVAEAITRSREAAVDAVQEAFASALHNRLSYRGAGPLEAWIWRSVVNAALRSLRERSDLPLDRSGDGLSSERDSDERLRSVVAGLPERQRLVVFLRYYADLDYRTIADALQVQVGTVGAALSQAHTALFDQLTEVRNR